MLPDSVLAGRLQELNATGQLQSMPFAKLLDLAVTAGRFLPGVLAAEAKARAEAAETDQPADDIEAVLASEPTVLHRWPR